MDHQVILGSERSEKVDHRNTFGSIVLGILVAIPAFAVIPSPLETWTGGQQS